MNNLIKVIQERCATHDNKVITAEPIEVNWTEHFKRVSVQHHKDGTLIKMDGETLITIGKSLQGY